MMEKALLEIEEKARLARAASRPLSYASSAQKDAALKNIARCLLDNEPAILEANLKDQNEAKASGMLPAMLDRLIIDQSRLEGIAKDTLAIAALPDPVGEIFDMNTMPNGLIIGKKRVPLGVIAAIYESRPNVTVDIASLCLKAGNAVILRGGKETIHSNTILAKLIRQAVEQAGLPKEAVQFIENTDRNLVNHLLKLSDQIDLVIPRGGAGLISYVKQNSFIPVVAGGIGVVHVYVDADAKVTDAVNIAYNSKVQRPTVCNAMDTLLVHKDIAPVFLPAVAAEWSKAGVEIRADEAALKILENTFGCKLIPATPDDWGKEFLALIAAVKVVDSLDEALSHIARYGSGHTESIVTQNYTSSQRFLNEVDAAAVMVNASTRFTDGSQFGLGAELGISTQKMHARGPMGLKEITSYKWIVYGSGQIRG